MDKVHVLIAIPSLKKAYLEKIAAVDPRVEVTYATEELLAELGMTNFPALPAGYPAEPQLTPEEAARRLDRILAHTEVIFSMRLPRNLLSRAPHLRWVQTIGAGVDHLARDPSIFNSDIMITNASGINSTSVAEYAIYLMLMLAKKAPGLFAIRESHHWEHLTTLELEGRTLGIVGLGRIGSKVARLARAFGMRVLATRRSATRRQKATGGVDELFPAGELRQMLRESDFVIVTVPLTPETRGMIGEAELRSMKPTSYIINVARGPVVRQDVLLRALREGWIAGAGLDVFEREPLPPESELWGLPNVIISPHLAGISEHEAPALADFFCTNLKRFLNGEKLVNLVDKKRGY
jgi:phosphoglycerate dehydrogenase-like enzyme